MTLTDCKYYVFMIFIFSRNYLFYVDTDRPTGFFLYTFLYFLFFICIIDFYINWIFLFCNSAFEQGHLDTWRYKNALIITIIITNIM